MHITDTLHALTKTLPPHVGELIHGPLLSSSAFSSQIKLQDLVVRIIQYSGCIADDMFVSPTNKASRIILLHITVF